MNPASTASTATAATAATASMRRPSASGRLGRAGVGPGFTVTELLVTIAIIGVLIGISFPLLRGARESGRRAACLSNLRSQAAGVIGYVQANRELLPKASAYIDVPKLDLGLADALRAFLDAPMPVAVDGTITSPQPWRCPSDPGLHRVTGGSYEYVAGRIMAEAELFGIAENVQADVSIHFRERAPGASIILDAGAPFIEDNGMQATRWHPGAGAEADQSSPNARLGAYLDGHADWGSGGS
jgi:prepilin-type N-terminal cleavage/methylation domain-containing protein